MVSEYNKGTTGVAGIFPAHILLYHQTSCRSVPRQVYVEWLVDVQQFFVTTAAVTPHQDCHFGRIIKHGHIVMPEAAAISDALLPFARKHLTSSRSGLPSGLSGATITRYLTALIGMNVWLE